MKAVILLLALSSTAVGAVPAKPPKTAAATSADARFKALYTSEYAWRQLQMAQGEDNPTAAARLPDVGPKAQAERLARWTAVSRQLAAITPASLSPANRINYAVYAQQIDALLTEQRYRDYEKPLTADTSFWGDVAESARGTFKSVKDYRDYIAVMRQIPRYFEQQTGNMRAGLARGFTPARVTLTGRDIGVAQVAEAKTPQDSPFYEPFKSFPPTISAADQATLRTEGAAAISQAVVPAYATLLKFLRTDYMPHAREGLAAYDLPDGHAYYMSKVREYTTQDITPEQIHALGLAEIAKIRGRMEGVMRSVKFQGDLQAFFNHLRTDPQFYPKTPNELLYRAAWIAKTFDGKASQWFGHLPRSRFAIKPVAPEIAPFYTGGRGGPGIYLVNTYDLPSRPFYSQVALTLHESAPGHAFQMPLASENKTLPAFRRDTYLSVYGEGWALYCETLGEDMGMYETPYDLFGMLSYQAWRAARLVVDTGIHSKGWSRKQAQDYLRDNTALSNHEIETEVDRYIAWPGQALSYYMGQMAFQAARKKAQAALGPTFNIRAFHDAMLEMGSVPVPVIEARTDQLIAAGGKGPYPDEE
ncbi:DUF885 family protein [Sphingomonas sp. UV9]|uniref:DUF885 domain-containing protein n=1 Tax=Sphingomonas sp. UV9 TaxID=1851410 RepID=UPI0026AF268E